MLMLFPWMPFGVPRQTEVDGRVPAHPLPSSCMAAGRGGEGGHGGLGVRRFGAGGKAGTSGSVRAPCVCMLGCKRFAAA